MLVISTVWQPVKRMLGWQMVAEDVQGGSGVVDDDVVRGAKVKTRWNGDSKEGKGSLISERSFSEEKIWKGDFVEVGLDDSFGLGELG